MPTETLRTDAQENRTRVLQAAREMFARRGIDVPMASIARRAGVGLATVYRRFPTRAALITEVFEDELAGCAGAVDEALADPDPWRGFVRVIENISMMPAAERGFTEAFLTTYPDAVDLDPQRRRAEAGFAEVVRRAKAAGRLREDFHPSDLIVLMLATCGATTGTDPATAQATARRLVAHLLRAFRTEDDGTPLPPPAPLGLDQIPR